MLISAKQIHNGHTWLPEGSVIDVSESGHINAINDPALQDEAVFYEGILTPGFLSNELDLLSIIIF